MKLVAIQFADAVTTQTSRMGYAFLAVNKYEKEGLMEATPRPWKVLGEDAYHEGDIVDSKGFIIASPIGKNKKENRELIVKAINSHDKLVEAVRVLRENLRWVAQTVHQAHHETGTYQTCSKNTCDAVNQVLTQTEGLI